MVSEAEGNEAHGAKERGESRDLLKHSVSVQASCDSLSCSVAKGRGDARV